MKTATKPRTKDAAGRGATKDTLLNAAEELMISKGFVATSVDEICEAAGVTKGSFFHYFESKEDLGKKLLTRYASRMGKVMEEASCCRGEDPLERMYGYLDCAVAMSKNPKMKGCLVGTFSQEITETHPDLRSLCAQSFNALGDMFRKDLKAAKAKYAPKANFDAGSLADYFIAISQGSMILVKAKKDRSVMEKNLLHFKRYLKTLFGK